MQIPLYSKVINLDTIANSGQCFRWVNVDSDNVTSIDKQCYTVSSRDRRCTMSIHDGVLDVDCSVEDEDSWKTYMNLEYRVEEDVLSFELSRDPLLKEAYKFAPGMHLLQQDFWETIVSFIISQNNNIPRIKNCINKVVASYGHFPTHEDILNAPDVLSQCSLGYRDSYLVNAAGHFTDLSRYYQVKMSHEDKISLLKQIKGVGDKVANCISLFSWGDYVACPIDVWMRRVISEDYGGTVPGWMLGEHAGYFQQLIFYYKRNGI